MARRTDEERLKALLEREEAARKKMEEQRKARKALESFIRTRADKLERKARTKRLIEMGGVLASIGFDDVAQVDRLKDYLLALPGKGPWAPALLKKLFGGELPEKFSSKLPPAEGGAAATKKPAGPGKNGGG